MDFETRAEYMARIDPKTLDNPGGHVVFDEDALLAVDRDDMMTIRVEVNGDIKGSIKVCSLLDDAVIARNLSWRTELNLGFGIVYDATQASAISVSKANTLVQITL